MSESSSDLREQILKLAQRYFEQTFRSRPFVPRESAVAGKVLDAADLRNLIEASLGCWLGYNLKMTDMQAAVGLSQLDKLPAFVAARRLNFQYLYDGLKPLGDLLLLPESIVAQWMCCMFNAGTRLRRSLEDRTT